LPATNFAAGGALSGLASSSPEGGDNAADENTDENGQNTLVNGGVGSTLLRLHPNREPANEPSQTTYKGALDDDNVNMTVDFAFQPLPARVEGVVYIDVNLNGLYEIGVDAPIAQVDVVITDVKGTSTTVATNPEGYYAQTVPAGLTQVRVNEGDADFPKVSALTIADPNLTGDNKNPGSTLAPAGGVGIENTGYIRLDWGDMPDSGSGTNAGNYNTLLSDNGARHSLQTGLYLGDGVDVESNGQPDSSANSDDVDGAIDDEDGVAEVELTLIEDLPAVMRISATNQTAKPATLYGFVDFNGDGDFGDPGEATSAPVAPGSDHLQVTLNFAGSMIFGVDTTYARFRLSSTAALGATGLALDGEVEDYPIRKASMTPPPPPPSLFSYLLDKRLLSVDPMRVGEPVDFAVTITNSGDFPIMFMPLADIYNPAYLTFQNATLAPNDSANDGQIDWSDIIGAEKGCGALDPGGVCTIRLRFIAKADTTVLPGRATVNTVRIGDVADTASVRIFSVTSVELTSREVTRQGKQVLIKWVTAQESTVTTFHLWREENTQGVIRLTEQPILAQHAGQALGAVYSYSDTTTNLERNYRYLLEMVDLEGKSSYSEVGRIGGRLQTWLPVISW
jgi:hypothetical protein